MVTFDHVGHRYVVDGHDVPSVTQRIETAGLLGPAASFYNSVSAERGTRVHLACLDLDFKRAVTLPDDERGYLDSYDQWRTMVSPAWTSLEQPHYSSAYHTAGTADRLGTIGGTPVVLDFKTGAPAPWHGLQLAMYDLLYCNVPPQQRRRIALYLRQDGRLAQSVEFHAAADYIHALELMKRTVANGTNSPDNNHAGAGPDSDLEPEAQPRAVEPNNRARRTRRPRRRPHPRR